MSWRPEVIADSTGQWVGNGLRFATRKEAEQNAWDLAARWTAVRDTRAVESDEPVNYTYHDGQLRALIAVPEPEPEPAQLVCSICEGPIEPHGSWTRGHNAQPINDGRCCDDCNSQVVIPRRIAGMLARQKG